MEQRKLQAQGVPLSARSELRRQQLEEADRERLRLLDRSARKYIHEGRGGYLQGRPNLDYIQVIKKQGGAIKQSYLEPGFILEKRIGCGMPKRLTNCKVLVANTPMDTDKIKIYGSRVKVDSLEAVQEVRVLGDVWVDFLRTNFWEFPAPIRHGADDSVLDVAQKEQTALTAPNPAPILTGE